MTKDDKMNKRTCSNDLDEQYLFVMQVNNSMNALGLIALGFSDNNNSRAVVLAI